MKYFTMHRSGEQGKTMVMRGYRPLDTPTQFQLELNSARVSLQKKCNAIKAFCLNFNA